MIEIMKTSIDTKELEKKAIELKSLRALAEDFAKQAEAVEEEIKNEMLLQGLDELDAGYYKIKWTPVTSRRLDVAALRKAMPALAEHFTKISETRRFSVKTIYE